MKDSIIYEKAFKFAVRVVEQYRELTENKKEYVLSKQFLKAGTSIGANVREGLEGQSKKDFVAKLSIALKEACETEYWIELMVATSYLSESTGKALLADVMEIIRILNSILKTSRKNLECEVS